MEAVGRGYTGVLVTVFPENLVPLTIFFFLTIDRHVSEKDMRPLDSSHGNATDVFSLHPHTRYSVAIPPPRPLFYLLRCLLFSPVFVIYLAQLVCYTLFPFLQNG